MAKMVRVNTRVSEKLNNWLDQESEESGMAKSTLIMLALENFHQQKQAMGNIEMVLQKLEKIESRLPAESDMETGEADP